MEKRSKTGPPWEGPQPFARHVIHAVTWLSALRIHLYLGWGCQRQRGSKIAKRGNQSMNKMPSLVEFSPSCEEGPSHLPMTNLLFVRQQGVNSGGRERIFKVNLTRIRRRIIAGAGIAATFARAWGFFNLLISQAI